MKSTLYYCHDVASAIRIFGKATRAWASDSTAQVDAHVGRLFCQRSQNFAGFPNFDCSPNDFRKKKDTPIFDKITEGNNPKMPSVPALLAQLAVELRYDAPASPPAHQEPVAGLYPLPLES